VGLRVAAVNTGRGVHLTGYPTLGVGWATGRYVSPQIALGGPVVIPTLSIISGLQLAPLPAYTLGKLRAWAWLLVLLAPASDGPHKHL